MEDRLIKLKKSMDQTVFSNLNFTEQHQNEIREKAKNTIENDNEITLAILQLLVNNRTGHELALLLNARGVSKFVDAEGMLYTLLHELEHDKCIQSNWNESKVKYYYLAKKGIGILRKSEIKNTEKQVSLKELFGGEA